MQEQKTFTKDDRFVDYYWYWLKLYKQGQVRPKTFSNYTLVARQLERMWPDKKIGEVTADSFQQLVNEFAPGHARGSIQKFYTYARIPLLRLHHYEKLIDRDPTYGVKIPNAADAHLTRAKFLEKDQLQRLIKTLEFDQGTYSDGFMIVLRTGMRFGEFMGITPDDINFDKGTLTINKTWDYADRNTPYDRFQPTKNKHSIREIVIDGVTMECFKRNMEGCGRGETIFGTIACRQSSGWNKHLARICEFAQIPRLSMHSLRHEHATFLADENIPTKEIAERLGHANDQITQKVYIHRLESAREKGHEQILEELAKIG